MAQLPLITHAAAATNVDLFSKNCVRFFFLLLFVILFRTILNAISALISLLTLPTALILFLMFLLLFYTFFLLYIKDEVCFKKIFYEPFHPFLSILLLIFNLYRKIRFDYRVTVYAGVFLMSHDTLILLDPELFGQLLEQQAVFGFALTCDKFDYALANGDFGRVVFNKQGFANLPDLRNFNNFHKFVAFMRDDLTQFDKLYNNQIKLTYGFIRENIDLFITNDSASVIKKIDFNKIRFLEEDFSYSEKSLLFNSILELAKEIPINAQQMTINWLTHPILVTNILPEYSALGDKLDIKFTGHFLTHFRLANSDCSIIGDDAVALNFKNLKYNKDLQFLLDAHEFKFNRDSLHRVYGQKNPDNFFKTLHDDGKLLVSPTTSFERLPKDSLITNLQHRFKNIPVTVGIDGSGKVARNQLVSLRPIQFTYTHKLGVDKQSHLILFLKPQYQNLYKNLLTDFSQCRQFDAFSKNIAVRNCDYKISAEMAQTIIKLFRK